MPDDFFREQSDASLVKTTIVRKYFAAWARVMLSSCRSDIAYVDLFAGPGYYDDGSPSTPIEVLSIALADEALRQRLITVFNDADPLACGRLREAIARLDGVGQLSHPPEVSAVPVGSGVEQFAQACAARPTLMFADPWGYKGLSLDLIAGVVARNWGCDAIFFFNYGRVNAAVSNPAMRPHVDAILGPERVEGLLQSLPAVGSGHRNLCLMGHLTAALEERGCRYVLPFCFERKGQARVSHYLVFVSKHPKAYKIMKEIMCKASSEQQDDGAAPFRYVPVDAKCPLPIEVFDPVARLVATLPTEYAGSVTTVGQLFTGHNVGRPYIEKHYRDALKRLESEGIVVCTPPASERRKNTMADSVLIHFPEKKP